MKIVVTGGAGFIGSHLVDELIQKGYEVYVLDNFTSGTKMINPKAIYYEADISSEETKGIIELIKPYAIFHLAAQADVGKSVENPVYDADVNIIGTINLLEGARVAGVKRFIFASTSAVYGNLNKELIEETDATMPASYYGLSKLTAEFYIKLYKELYNQSYTILRYANVYGPRQLPKGEGGVVSVFINRIKEGTPIHIHGDGTQTRDFIYVKDVVAANVAALHSDKDEVLQVSTSKRTSVNEIVSLLEGMHGSSIPVRHTASRSGDIKHSCLLNRKATELIHWKPIYSLENGLKETYSYSMGHMDKSSERKKL